jgi:hypothetical protein
MSPRIFSFSPQRTGSNRARSWRRNNLAVPHRLAIEVVGALGSPGTPACSRCLENARFIGIRMKRVFLQRDDDSNIRNVAHLLCRMTDVRVRRAGVG